MSASRHCEKCGKNLTDAGSGFICPVCVAQIGLASWLDLPSPEPADGIEEQAPDSFIEASGPVAGRYELLKKIGEGGFGTVYLAQQEQPIRRQVALKIIKPGMDSRQVLRRFDTERHVLARMDHPNIARFYDAGVAGNGRPYFVMELVHGVPITEYCNHCALTTTERLQLFTIVCQAVQHAHQKGVIHRDLKPSNVLVAMQEGKPAPKVIDFGVAKAIEDPVDGHTRMTAFAQMIGTPLYMSPEQAGLSPLGVDTRTDIYSLGVLLYELLTSATPLEAGLLKTASQDELRRCIREDEPPRPSTRISTLCPGLAAEAAQQRRTDPRSLFHTVRGDLDWITMKCLEKDCSRRYETAAALAADLNRCLRHEPVEARPPSTAYRFAKFVRRNRQKLGVVAFASAAVFTAVVSVAWNIQSRSAIQARLKQEISRTLQEAHAFEKKGNWPEALAAAARANALLSTGTVPSPDRDRVEITLTPLELLTRLERIRIETLSGDTEIGFDCTGADRAYADAFREFGIDPARLPGPLLEFSASTRSALAAMLDEWSRTQRHLKIAGWERLTESAQRIDPDPWRTRLRKAWRDEDSSAVERLAASIPVERLAPASLTLLARVLEPFADREPAIELLREAQHVYPDDVWINYDLARLLEGENTNEAIEFYRAALALRPESAGIHFTLAVALTRIGRTFDAASHFRDAIRLDPNSILAHVGLSDQLREQQAVVAARENEEFLSAVDAFKKNVVQNSQSSRDYRILGMALGRLGRLHEAEAAFREAIRLEPGDSTSHVKFGEFLCDKQDYAGAATAFQAAIDLHSEDPAAAHYGLGNALKGLGKFEEAEAAYREATRLQPSFFYAHINLGNLCDQKGDYQGAVATFQQAAAIAPAYPMTHFNLGNAFGRQNKWEEAEAAYRRAVELHPNDPQYGHNLAVALVQLERIDEAIAQFRGVLAIDQNRPDTYNLLGHALCRKGSLDDALLAFRKAIEVDPGHSCHHHALGQTLERMGDIDAAVDAFVQSVQSPPEHASHYTSLWSASVHRRELDLQLQTLRQAVRRDPSNAGHHHKLGDALSRQGRTRQALASWLAATEADPGFVDPRVLLAWNLATSIDPMLRNSAEAVVHAQEAVELDPSANNYNNLGVAHYRAGNWAEAVKNLERADAMMKDGDRAHRCFLAMAYWQLGDKEQARRCYDQALVWMEQQGHNKRYPGHEYRRFRKEAEELMSLDRQDPTELLEIAFSRALNDSPVDPALWAARAQMYCSGGSWDQAASDWVEAITRTKETRDWNSPRKDLCRQLASWPEAFSRVAALLPHEPALWMGRGQHHALRSQWTEAASSYEAAFALNPSFDETLFEFGGTLLLVGRHDVYRSLCAEAVAREGDSNDTFHTFVLARTCSIDPAGDIPPERLVRWANRRVEDKNSPWSLHVAGLAHYRSGQFDTAIRSLEGSLATRWGTLPAVQNHLVLAMICQRRQNSGEARQILHQAQRLIADARPLDPSKPVETPVPDWIALELLLREAQGLIP